MNSTVDKKEAKQLSALSEMNEKAEVMKNENTKCLAAVKKLQEAVEQQGKDIERLNNDLQSHKEQTGSDFLSVKDSVH